jgi:DNA-binding XRE family transcriptional regulator
MRHNRDRVYICARSPRGAARRRRRRWMISPEGFRTLRLSCFLSQRTAAELLGVSVRTVRHWDHERSRVPWSVVRLLRIVRSGELPASGWDGWRVLDGGRLVTPAGEVFRASEFVWWALTVPPATLPADPTRSEPSQRQKERPNTVQDVAEKNPHRNLQNETHRLPPVPWLAGIVANAFRRMVARSIQQTLDRARFQTATRSAAPACQATSGDRRSWNRYASIRCSPLS